MSTRKSGEATDLIDPEIRCQAEGILADLGLTVSKSYELFCRQVIAHRGLPFEVRVPNEKTMKAIENSRKGKGKVFSSPEALFEDLGI
jgi:DNA-damage-inducible protein J